MLDNLVLAGPLHGTQTKKHGVIAKRARQARLLDGLLGPADDAGDHNERMPGPAGCGLGCQLQHGAVEAGLADLELGGVYANGEPAGTGTDVVAGERALRLAIELPRRV